MSWSKAKTILILVFLLVNVFLFATYHSIVKSGEDMDVGQLHQVLQKHNITLKQNVFKAMPRRLQSVEFRNLAGDKVGCAQLFWKDGYTAVSDTVFQNGTQQLTIQRSALEFVDSAPADESYRGISQEKAGDKVADYLRILGIPKQNLRQTNVIRQENGELVFSYQMECGGVPVFNSSLQVSVGESGITGIRGVLLTLKDENAIRIDYQILSLQNILLELLSNPELDPATSHRVVDVELGYYVPKNDAVISTEAIPAYRIQMESGKRYYYDARSGVPNTMRLLAVENEKQAEK